MSVNATLTMLVSTTSSNAPSATAIAIAHLLFAVARGPSWVSTPVCAIGASNSRLFAGVDREIDAHPGPQQNTRGQPVQPHTYRQSLHDFGEIPGGVVRGKQREFGASGAREALDFAFERGPTEGVDLYTGRLPDPHLGDLRLFEVARHPELVSHQLHDALPGRQHLSDTDALLRKHAIAGGENLAVR